MDVVGDGIGPVIGFSIKVVVATCVYAIYRIKRGWSASARETEARLQPGRLVVVRRPVHASLKRPDAIELPAPQQDTGQVVAVSKKGNLPNVVEGEAVPNIKDGVASVEIWFGLVRSNRIAGRNTVYGDRTALPSGSIIDRVAVSIIPTELQTPTHAFRYGELQCVISRTGGVLPDAQSPVIGV